MDKSPRLSLPYILPSQAQKHLTHNEALALLDCLVQLTVEMEAQSPPTEPRNGECYAVSPGATGAWSGYDGMVATLRDEAWSFWQPLPGYQAWFRTEAALKIFDGVNWIRPDLPQVLTPQRLGIGATPDDYNRLLVSSPATLLNHAGNSHRVTINKAAAGDTASILFQSNWSGRAEMGLAGSDSFSFKVSYDGVNWNTALHIRPDGAVNQPMRPLGRVRNEAGSTLVTSGSTTGFTTVSLEQGGISLGSTLAGGGKPVIVPIEGLYRLDLKVTVSTSSTYHVSLNRETGEPLTTLRFPSSAPVSLYGSTLANLAAGEKLVLTHQGTATVTEGPAETELTLIRL